MIRFIILQEFKNLDVDGNIMKFSFSGKNYKKGVTGLYEGFLNGDRKYFYG